MFIDVLSTLKYCINDKISEGIKSQLSPYYRVNCSDLCSEFLQSKYIPDENKCIINCSNSEFFNFEYENVCFISCPNGTHPINSYLCEEDLICHNYYNYERTECLDEIPLGYYLNSTIDKTLDKCNIKCSNCTKESTTAGLCISCNNDEGYYQKENEELNENSFIDCYNGEQLGYYLDEDEKKYNPCYSACKSCSRSGDSEHNNCLECPSDLILNNGNCESPVEEDTTTNTEEITNKITNEVSEISNESIYSYKIDLDSSNSKQNYKNVTFVEFTPEEIEFFYNKFKLDRELDKIYAIVSDYISEDSKMATRGYNFRLFLENGTELNLSNINEDIYLDFYVPIDDLDSTNFNFAKEMISQGYDIYDKNSDFYHDFCSAAHLGENDITLKDRRKYIYPNNVSLCKENCKYNGIDIEDQRVICSCNLNANKSYEDEEDNIFVEEDGNFISYLLDNINYKVFKCYNLISSFENLKNNYAFWTILGVYAVLIIINLIFYLYSMPMMKKLMAKEIPTSEKIRKEIAQELLRFRSLKGNTALTSKESKTNINKTSRKDTSSFLNPNKKKTKRKSKKSTKKLSSNNFIPYKEDQRKETTKINKKKNRLKPMQQLTNRREDTQSPSLEKFIKKNEVEIPNVENNKSYSNEEINDLSYNQAVILDKRNALLIFGSLLITKIELIYLFCSNSSIRIMLIGEYILSLLVNFFFNALLYSDEVVSNKYHNNGKLDLVVTLVLSILSNIITSIICYILQYTKGLDERSELIKEIKIKKYYVKNVNIFFKYLKIKFFLLLFL